MEFISLNLKIYTLDRNVGYLLTKINTNDVWLFWFTLYIMCNRNAENSRIIFLNLHYIVNYSIITEKKYNVYQ